MSACSGSFKNASITWLTLFILFFSARAFSANPEIVLEVNKADRTLVIKEGSQIKKKFIAAVGRGGRGDKHMIGDQKTPVGSYRVVDFHEDSPFEFFIHLNYPNVKDAFFGLQDKTISRRDFDKIIMALQNEDIPPQDTKLGGAIGIHGIGEENRNKLRMHRAQNWTKGCIALTNEEIKELKKYVQIGTLVVIK